jgi:GT2 family glycosyltransferase
MLNIIYSYRNRDVQRIEKSLNSLRNQSEKKFCVHFVDYGSHSEQAKKVQALVENFSFVKYVYYPTNLQPWNKSKALNSVIKNLDDGFCFVADIDMIFHPNFIAYAAAMQKANTAVYFKVGFLSEAETKQDKRFNDYVINFESTSEATGLTLFPVKAIKKINGFDEFYHFWGAEDTDIHVRLKNDGCKIIFYDEKILLLHQWHVSYRKSEVKELSEELQLSGIVKLNHQHLKYASKSLTTKVNSENWGTPLSNKSYELLLSFNDEPIIVTNKKEEIDHLLFCELLEVNSKIKRFIIKPDNFEHTLKYKVKKVLKKKVPRYYSLKEVNNMLLMHIIVFYRDYNYTYKVLKSKNSIELTLFK